MTKHLKKYTLIGLALLPASNIMGAKTSEKPVYKNPDLPVEARVADLLSRMTLEEKVLQLNQYTLGRNNNINNIGEEVKELPAEIGSLIYFDTVPGLRNAMQRHAVENSRLGIPVLFGYDAIHGFKTIYPISLAQACSWNPSLVEAACHVSAAECRTAGVDWTFSPMVDVARDPRWGRVAEGYGEDPYVNSVFCVASVKGYQGNDLSDSTSIAACLKHFVGYAASEAGRDYVYTEISPLTLWNTYLPPFEAGVKAGAATLMSSFNDISGVPASANSYTMTDIVKDRWGHPGFIVSDWAAIEQLINQGNAADKKEAAMNAFNAGLEMDMMSHAYDRHLVDLVKEGKVSEKDIDKAVSRVLELKFRLGLFDNPYTPEQTNPFLRPDYIDIATRLAAESMVLLKNDSTGVLPLKGVSKIAMIGPMANNEADLLGSWSGHGNPDDVMTFYEGVSEELGTHAEIKYIEGCKVDGDATDMFDEAVRLARWADVVILCLGEKKNWSGENASRSVIELPEIQQQLAGQIAAQGKPVVLVLTNGRPLGLSRLEPLANAIIEAWQPGIGGGKALAGILSGRINPSGKLAITFPYSTGQIPIYYNRRKSGRYHQGFYQDITSKPMYEFGHGLSYTTFEYGNPKSDKIEFTPDEIIEVSVPVTNTGKVSGKETVLWYIADPVSSITRPVKELKHFEKKTIQPGETVLYTFTINPREILGQYDSHGNRQLEKGEYDVIVNGKTLRLNLK